MESTSLSSPLAAEPLERSVGVGIRINQACSKLSSLTIRSGLWLTGEEDEEEASGETSLKSKSIRSPLSVPESEPNLLILCCFELGWVMEEASKADRLVARPRLSRTSSSESTRESTASGRESPMPELRPRCDLRGKRRPCGPFTLPFVTWSNRSPDRGNVPFSSSFDFDFEFSESFCSKTENKTKLCLNCIWKCKYVLPIFCKVCFHLFPTKPHFDNYYVRIR